MGDSGHSHCGICHSATFTVNAADLEIGEPDRFTPTKQSQTLILANLVIRPIDGKILFPALANLKGGVRAEL